MLRVIEIIVYTLFLTGSMYIFLKRPTIIGYYYLTSLSSLNVGLLIYIANFHITSLGIRVLMLLVLIILLGFFFICVFIPLHTKYMNFKKAQLSNGTIPSHEYRIVPRVNKIIIWLVFGVSAPLVYIFLIFSKRIFLEETLRGLPTYSFLIILIAAILMFLATLVKAKQN
jgi:hypothetical protein